jgi:hypothetical protein
VEPAGNIHICQTDPAFVPLKGKLSDQPLLVIFQEDFSADIYLQIIVGGNFFFHSFQLPHFQVFLTVSAPSVNAF